MANTWGSWNNPYINPEDYMAWSNNQPQTPTPSLLPLPARGVSDSVTPMTPYGLNLTGSPNSLSNNLLPWFQGAPSTTTTNPKLISSGQNALQDMIDVTNLKNTVLGGGTPTTPTIPLPAVRWEIISQNGWDVQVGYDAQGNVVSADPLGQTRQETPVVSKPSGLFNSMEEALVAAGNTGYRPIQLSSGYWSLEEPLREETTSPFQQAQLDQEKQQQEQMIAWYREQAQMQAEQERQTQLANLRANPASWLEYASVAGETPSVQPWMMPLMPQQYQGVQAGTELPGYQAGGSTMAGLVQLTPPSRQYQARMGPTALQQYGGYERARSGITPEELQFRLWSSAPPSGSQSGLTWQR